MKKTLLALAITALSANVFAASVTVTAEGTTAAPAVFAKEIAVAASGTAVGTDDLVVNLTSGFALSEGFIRIELSNGAKFADVPTFTVAGGTPAALPAAGGKDQNFVILKFAEAAPGTPVAANAAIAVTLVGGVKVVNKDAVALTYSLHQLAGEANNKTNALKTLSAGLVSFADAVEFKQTSLVSTNLIDAIGSESKQFITAGGVRSTTQDLVTLEVAAADYAPNTAGVQTALLPSGAVATPANIIASTKWTLAGNFSAVAANGLTSSVAATTEVPVIAADKQAVTFTNAAAGGSTTQNISYKVTGTDEIAETGVAVSVEPTAATGYVVSPVSLGTKAALKKNGKTEVVNLALKPGGAYSNFVRISNTDTITGAFFIKVINDAGKSVSFPLSAVNGQPATLTAGASTTQMSIQSIYDAAVAKDATFATSGEGKLRLEVTGQTNGLNVQSYTVSKDGNSFATF